MRGNRAAAVLEVCSMPRHLEEGGGIWCAADKCATTSFVSAVDSKEKDLEELQLSLEQEETTLRTDYAHCR